VVKNKKEKKHLGNMSIDHHMEDPHGHDEKHDSATDIYQDLMGFGAGGALGYGTYTYLTAAAASIPTATLFGAVGAAVIGTYFLTKMAFNYFSNSGNYGHDDHAHAAHAPGH
jgi:hypothetical protein